MPMPSSSTTAEDPLGFLAGVDDHPAIGAVAADDEAVLGHLADGEHADFHAARLAPEAAQPCCFFCARAACSWRSRRRYMN